MKKFLIFALTVVPFIVFAQKSIDVKDVPSKYTQDFERNHQNATQAKWYQIDSTTYEVKFVSNDMRTSVRFKNVSMETRWEVNPQYIPASIKAYIDSAYTKAKIEYAYILDISKNKSYEVGIKEKKDEYLLTFELGGTFKEAIKQESAKKAKASKRAKKEKK